MTNSKYKIYVDMDGVLTDWEKQFETYSGVPVDNYIASHGKKNQYQFLCLEMWSIAFVCLQH